MTDALHVDVDVDGPSADVANTSSTFLLFELFRVWMEFTVSTGKRSEHPRGMPLVPMPARLKRAGVGTNGILECKSLSKNGHRTVPTAK
jgi:hypothetical protein